MKTATITPEMVEYGYSMTQVPAELKGILWSVPDRCSGALTIGNTRFQLTDLLDNLVDEGTLEDFYHYYPQAIELQFQIEKVLDYLFEMTRHAE